MEEKNAYITENYTIIDRVTGEKQKYKQEISKGDENIFIFGTEKNWLFKIDLTDKNNKKLIINNKNNKFTKILTQNKKRNEIINNFSGEVNKLKTENTIEIKIEDITLDNSLGITLNMNSDLISAKKLKINGNGLQISKGGKGVFMPVNLRQDFIPNASIPKNIASLLKNGTLEHCSIGIELFKAFILDAEENKGIYSFKSITYNVNALDGEKSLEIPLLKMGHYMYVPSGASACAVDLRNKNSVRFYKRGDEYIVDFIPIMNNHSHITLTGLDEATAKKVCTYCYGRKVVFEDLLEENPKNTKEFSLPKRNRSNKVTGERLATKVQKKKEPELNVTPPPSTPSPAPTGDDKSGDGEPVATVPSTPKSADEPTEDKKPEEKNKEEENKPQTDEEKKKQEEEKKKQAAAEAERIKGEKEKELIKTNLITAVVSVTAGLLTGGAFWGIIGYAFFKEALDILKPKLAQLNELLLDKIDQKNAEKTVQQLDKEIADKNAKITGKFILEKDREQVIPEYQRKLSKFLTETLEKSLVLLDETQILALETAVNKLETTLLPKDEFESMLEMSKTVHEGLRELAKKPATPPPPTPTV